MSQKYNLQHKNLKGVTVVKLFTENEEDIFGLKRHILQF